MGIQVEDHLKLVMHIAKRFQKRNDTTLDDLFQEGCIALIKAVEDYDESKGVPFSSFAGQRIQFHILNYLNDINLIRKPRHVGIVANRIRKLGLEEKSAEFLSEHLQEALTSVKLALEHLKEEYSSLDFKISKENNNLKVVDVLDSKEDSFEVSENKMLLDNPGFKVSDKDKKLLGMVMEGYSQQQILEATGYKNIKYISDKLRRLRAKFRQELVL